MIGEFSFVSGSPVSFDRAEGGSARIEGPMIKEGVWNGIYVPADAIAEAMPSILGRYWLLGHLDEGSEPSWHSASMGIVTEAEVKGDEAETWINIDPWLDRIPPELTKVLEAGERIGVSADFRAQFVEEEGEYNGVPYSERVLHMYYLHVACVPLGACSVDDGCFSRMSFKSGVGTMVKKNEKVVHQAEGDSEEEEGTVTVVSFNRPEDVQDFVQMVQDQDDPAVALEMMIGFADWVVSNWTDGTGPFIPPMEPVGEEGLSEKEEAGSVKLAKKDKEGEKGPRKLTATQGFIKKRLMKAMPHLTEERFEEEYGGVDESVLIAILEDIEALLDSVETVAEEIEEVVAEIKEEVDETPMTRVSQARAPAPKAATKIRIPKPAQSKTESFAERKKSWNQRLGIRSPPRDRSGRGGA